MAMADALFSELVGRLRQGGPALEREYANF